MGNVIHVFDDLKTNLNIIEGNSNNHSTGISSQDMKKSKWVDPIKDIEDIKKIENFLQEKIDNCTDIKTKRIYARNKLLFVFGTRTGFRVNDLIEFKLGLIFNKKGDFYINPQNVTENKTGKTRQLILTENLKKEVVNYLEIANIDIDRDNYIFIGKDKRYEIYDIGLDQKIIDDMTIDINTVEYETYLSKGKIKKRKIKNSGIKHRGLKKSELETKKEYLDRFNIPYKIRRYHISTATVDTVIKNLTEETEIEGNYAGRSLRKTFAYRQYLNGVKRGMTELESADNVKKILNHSTVQITYRYLGLSQKEARLFMEDTDWE